MPRLKGVSFETAIIERYHRLENIVKEALIEMYLTGVSVRWVEDIIEALGSSKAFTLPSMSRTRNLMFISRTGIVGRTVSVCLCGWHLPASRLGQRIRKYCHFLVAIAVNEDGFRDILGAAEGMKEDKASWASFFQWLCERSMNGMKLIVGDTSARGCWMAVGEVFSNAKYQRCVVHFFPQCFLCCAQIQG